MKNDDGLDEIDRFRRLLQWAEQTAAANKLLNRLIRQAVLTHGGELRVDVALAEEAANEDDPRQLEIGNGMIRLAEYPK